MGPALLGASISNVSASFLLTTLRSGALLLLDARFIAQKTGKAWVGAVCRLAADTLETAVQRVFVSMLGSATNVLGPRICHARIGSA